MIPKNIEAFTSKQKLGRAIDGVLIMPDRIVATDSFKLIERKADTGVKEPVCIMLPKGLKTFESIKNEGGEATIYNKGAAYSVATRDASEYPKYEAVIPTGEAVASVRVNAQYLAEIAAAFKDIGDSNVLISFYGAVKPLVFKSTKDEQLALLMPVVK